MENLLISAGGFGSDGYGKDVDLSLLPDNLGGVVLKTTTLNSITGNPEPNVIIHKDGSIINAIGLKNPGIRNIIVPDNVKCPIYLSLYAQSMDEWEELIGLANKISGLSGFELNLSCPNLDNEYLNLYSGATNVSNLVSVSQLVAEQSNLPVWVKLAPNHSEIPQIANGLYRYTKVAGIILSNTIMAIDPETRMLGGLSGPPLRPITMRLVYLTHKQLPNLQITASGGISSKEHINQYNKAGAVRYQIASAFYKNNFKLPDDISH